jgi:hypothetical protein
VTFAEGMSAAAEGAAALVGVERLVNEGRITRSDTSCCSIRAAR